MHRLGDEDDVLINKMIEGSEKGSDPLELIENTPPKPSSLHSAPIELIRA